MASPAPQHFPDRPQFSDFMKPCRFEGEIQNLEVHGDLPNDIDGTFYRVMPDPQLPPFIDNDPWFNGDGNISAFRIKNGSVTFQQKYVRTEKFVREREAGRALIGKYRNKFTDAVGFNVRSTANTNIVSFNGQLLALKEDSPPYAMDPKTLETKGLYTFDGQLPSVTFTAHPKTDPMTGELVCFGYEAKGDGSPDICYYTIGPDGKFTQTVWLVAPVCGMIHDCAVTENWVLFPVIPQLSDLERLKQGGEHWQWSPETPLYIGVIPRYGAKPSDVKWFTYKNSFPSHTANAYEQDDGKIVFDLGLSDKNVFFWWADAQGNSPEPSKIHTQLTRFTVDPKAEEENLPEPEVLHDGNSEFYRIDDRFFGRKYSHCYFDLMDPSLGTDFAAIGPVMGGGYPPYNSLAHHDESTGKTEIYFPGSTHLVQEPIFIPRACSTEEGDGYLMALVNNYRNMSSELHLLDCRDFTKARAIIMLPLRLRPGLHGNWVDNN
ncbi:Carotenoid oxygenase [Penicillium canescens]|uniref:Carotenoid oxygenase n=1 Tax=Penicillium canescens TaxID=5083 RepID=A0AAD6IB51_PENCN|nr:Carotenoid oxygenase [Penicillium canescens]XP_058368422.1 Carotenoid oxygenase [Penicillium canescens]KAJ5981591.1 Carotenoid oxygenase [Penicillium canescens]KAJ6022322.1 Carotenoid oxygenase [Penicillium canescens]KAJ6038969.1 Carotenoid oxygenase [Penicillium canescens]KAJ6041270.1 Carotenoid oxygenase [Penicillium canescens]KAJ6050732.1 Carotenoid oxygenase [Penicillium canescens]